MSEVTITTHDSQMTERIGQQIGRHLKGGEVIELISDLGGGKTTLVRGIARGFGSADRVASPTFTISKIYTARAKQIAHFDFYRLSDAGLTAHELAEFIDDPNTVVVVEWGDLVEAVLPASRLTIHLKRLSNEARQLKLVYPSDLAYLAQELKP